MERAESVVVQVAPSYENHKIIEMEAFGWTLQNRQEIHEEGETHGRPSYLSDDTYVIETTVSHYVKLHFSRSTQMPNISDLKELESEYHNLPFPDVPSLKGPSWFIAFFVFGVVIGLGAIGQDPGVGILLLLINGGLVAFGIHWLRKRRQKRQEAIEASQRSQERAAALVNEATALLASG